MTINMITNSNLLGYVFAISAVVVMWVYFERAHKLKHVRFSGREDLTFDEIYQSYFSGTNIDRKKSETH